MEADPSLGSLDLIFVALSFVAAVFGYVAETRRDGLRERVTRLELEVEHLKEGNACQSENSQPPRF